MTTTHPIKILHIISGDLWAGAEVQAFTLLSTLQKIPEVEVAAVLMNEGELAHKLRAQHIPVTVFPENTMGPLAIFVELRRLMNAWQPDVVHTHRIKENILGAIANRFATRARSVRTAHGASEHPPKGLRNLHKHLLDFLNRWTGNHLQNAVIAVTSDLADKLTNEFNRDKIIAIENGIDIEATLAQIRKAGIRDHAPETKHVGLVGRLSPVKRVDLFLEAASLLSVQYPHTAWRFHIFGDGPLKNHLLQNAKQLKLERSLVFHGHRSDIIACISELDALVMCSDHEGLPMTLLESMCLGTPIIGHNVGGIKQLLQEGKSGWQVDIHSAQGYADAVIQCLQNPSLTKAKSESAKQLALKYSAEMCANRYLDVYKNQPAA